MPASDPHRAEREYLQRAAAGEWERFKPFSPPGDQTLAESTRLMQDFVAALALLQPSPTDLVLDLGAGACWVTDWLARLNVGTVSVDIAIDMLRLGRTRVPASARDRMAVGDMERLPFADGSFDKAVCLGSLHHVPSMRAAVGEIARVLTLDGSVVFAEPGRGHANTNASVVAMRDFGVLEHDVLIADLMQDCRRAGFEDVRLKPLSRILRDVELTLEGWREWNAWNEHALRRRPGRVAVHLRRAWRELVTGRGVSFGESFAAAVSEHLWMEAETRPVVLASKRARESNPLPPSAPAMTARISLAGAPTQVRGGGLVTFMAGVANTSDAIWFAQAQAGDKGHVRLGVQLLDGDHRLIDRDHIRVTLPGDLAPGQSAELTVAFHAPTEPGTYAMKLDMVLEGTAWFETTGSEAVVHELEVE